MSFRTAYSNTHSENRWRMCNRDECELVPGPYMNTAPIRRGPPAIILGDFARRYHAEVAPIVSPVWGWSNTNDVFTSNHLSGTALDINAPQWPWGIRRMSQGLIDRINRLLAFYEGAVFWGRNWSRPDEMHFQIGWPEGDRRLDGIVRKVQGTVAPPPPQNEINRAAAIAKDWIGQRITPGNVEVPCPDGKGRFAEYENAHVYWHPSVGAAYPIPHGGLFEAFQHYSFETGPLGYPVQHHTVLDDGGVQAFQKGILYRKNGSAQGVYVLGAIAAEYAATKFEDGPLGWPLTIERPTGDGGVVQAFEGGNAFWHPSKVVTF